MKRLLSILSLTLVCFAMVACGGGDKAKDGGDKDGGGKDGDPKGFTLEGDWETVRATDKSQIGVHYIFKGKTLTTKQGSFEVPGEYDLVGDSIAWHPNGMDFPIKMEQVGDSLALTLGNGGQTNWLIKK